MNNKKLLVLGAGGHGRVVAEIAGLSGYDVNFLDDSKLDNKNVIGKISDYGKYLNGYSFFVAIGNNELRKKLFHELKESKAEIIKLIHPKAVVSENATIGDGTVVMAGAVINPCTEIGQGCIINTCASVDHDCRIGDYVHVSVGAHVAGTVIIGDNTWIGAGATISNNIEIVEDCMIGAGAVVVKNIEESATYIGIPARKWGGGNS